MSAVRGGPVLRGDRTEARGAPPLGRILCERGALSAGDLDAALAEQGAVGARLGEVLAAKGMVKRDDIAAALAVQWGLGAADLNREPPDPGTGDPAALDHYLRHSIVPVRRIGKMEVYATCEPAGAAAALAELAPDHGVAFVTVAPRPAVEQALLDRFGPALAERATARTPPQLSVRTLGTARLATVIALAALMVALVLAADHALAALGFGLLLLNGTTTLTRIAALAASRRQGKQSAPPGTVALADRRPLPRITLLVPLYDEPAMIGPLVAALDRSDYPRALMDVKLLLEERDAATRAAVAEFDLPPWMEALVLPDGGPHTKPRALNMALDFCDGEIVGVLDAEDRPDPGQLRAVAEHLRNAPPEVACVQCQLAWFNARENWISRCFQIEYAIWFDVLLRGFQRLGLPIPLGGTSVYFRRSALRDLDGWDAHNVTEDADLGMRLARRGLRTDVIASVTEEEANFRVMPWIRQRSRWLKGYLLTWLNHMRSPARLWRDLGPVGFFGLNVLLLGGAVSYLTAPLFWVAVVCKVLTGAPVYGELMPGWAAWTLAVTLISGHVVMLGCAVLALRRRGELGLIGWVPTLLVYWMLGAAAAWKAVFELAHSPYYWDKTQHGVTRMAPPHVDTAAPASAAAAA
jgi:cellulose synthase/poly-beta-1,6-N-acetylglucosamine synthase-like glycosyltransferase